MTSIMSSPGGSAVYPNALTQLLGTDPSTVGNGSATPSATTTTPQAVPSLASVLSTDDTTGVGAQASSTITSLMMEIQALKSGVGSSSPTDASAAEGTDPADPQQGGRVHGHHHHHGGDGAAEASKAFSKIDADGSGSVSLAEFVAGRPKDMSEDDATKIFNSMDTAGTGSISEDQFATTLKQQHQAGSVEQTSAEGAGAAMSRSDMQALAQDIVQQLTQVIQSFNNGYVDSSAYGNTGTASVSTDQ